MSARVFISCGQANPDEKRVARNLSAWFKGKGFDPYVAIEAQSLDDINSGILGELKRSDFYVFVDFRRERLSRSARGGRYFYRGSLFTNQELAIAHLLRFEKAIFLQQSGIQLEGMLKYMASNAEKFKRAEEVPALVRRLVRDRRWLPSYSRHLELGLLHWTRPVNYRDHTGTKRIVALEIDIHNRRTEFAAIGAVARLRKMSGSKGKQPAELDISPLKAVGRYAYEHVIWPERHVAWDLLAVHLDSPGTVSLNSALDVVPRRPLLSLPGKYLLEYEVMAVNFPVLTFEVSLTVSPGALEVKALVRSSEGVVIKPKHQGSA